MRKNYFFPFFLLLFMLVNGQKHPLMTQDSILQQQWVDGHYETMTLEEKIGQLFMVSVASNANRSATERIKKLIDRHHIGGVIFLRGSPTRQAKLTNEYQSMSKIPLLIGQDAEWGLAMRLDSTYAFPWNMTLGAIQDSTIVEEVAYQMGKHAKRLGVHINFAPVLDVNINPRNPIIGNRSFGENPENVSVKGATFIRGFERAGILSCGKHFPGHGDTATDSHHDLPLIDFSRQRLDSVELHPYKELIKDGLSSVMVAHLNVPALENVPERPSSLSKSIITTLLKNKMGFEGLVFTDALNMKAVTKTTDPGDVELSAFLAGNDMLLMPQEVDSAVKKLLEAYNYGIITENRLARSVKKILMAKYKVALSGKQRVDTDRLYEDLNNLESDMVYEKAIENALTVVKNNFSLLPIKKLSNKKIAYVKLGDVDGDTFYGTLKKYADVTPIEVKDFGEYKKKLSEFNLVIVGYHKSNDTPWRNHKFSKDELFWLRQIAQMRSNNMVLVSFANPYALSDIVDFTGMDAILVAYQNSVLAQRKAAEVIFGALSAKGKLPVSINSEFPVNSGVEVKSIARLGYSIPERVGLSSKKLSMVDTLVRHGLDSLMYPGAQVLVARRGKIIYNKSFGHPTYTSKEKITEDHIYDLASLTKILSTLPVIMKMEEEGKIRLNDTFQELVPEYAESELKDVTVLKSLSHYGRLPAWIAFYVDTLNKDRKPSSEFYRNHPEEGYSIKVSEGLYLSNAYQDSIYNRIGRQELKSNRYRYSDVAYYVFKKYIENTYEKSLDRLATDFLYRSIGATNTGFNVADKFDKSRIVPSEEDNYFRYQTIHGYVHDMGAAMQGGVGGHAGLFSNANDVAKIMQMYLQGGYYGGERYLDERTIKKFNTCYFCHKDVRRGVGFDKPQLEDKGPTCGCVSHESFGHSGFTGTYTWADPEAEIVYVFLSNRTYPSAHNNLLVRSALRTRIQQAIYDSIIN
ncbi:glycoside hydrolase family 3 N-terminal domain-containing protein [Allomuricauda sp. SCSIO 65647]|uniref:glycoside hydrolase family 3 N-terminal domain-containing protein n=1 Tax=Allomuricauda sp. SCSIO 65647 TaxID=2908843 RepID=UPI001F18886A|nr:glycoside hydrolase family 3 N-terminal domain-containing protein [Muricauda sp. SCSIO 65647]UJH66998.1 serine hydrolase [Muricauda sp. SCSIO 65647]